MFRVVDVFKFCKIFVWGKPVVEKKHFIMQRNGHEKRKRKMMNDQDVSTKRNSTERGDRSMRDHQERKKENRFGKRRKSSCQWITRDLLFSYRLQENSLIENSLRRKMGNMSTIHQVVYESRKEEKKRKVLNLHDGHSFLPNQQNHPSNSAVSVQSEGVNCYHLHFSHRHFHLRWD